MTQSRTFVVPGSVALPRMPTPAETDRHLREARRLQAKMLADILTTGLRVCTRAVSRARL